MSAWERLSKAACPLLIHFFRINFCGSVWASLSDEKDCGLAPSCSSFLVSPSASRHPRPAVANESAQNLFFPAKLAEMGPKRKCLLVLGLWGRGPREELADFSIECGNPSTQEFSPVRSTRLPSTARPFVVLSNSGNGSVRRQMHADFYPGSGLSIFLV